MTDIYSLLEFTVFCSVILTDKVGQYYCSICTIQFVL